MPTTINQAGSPSEFDRFADEYEHMHARNIAITGEAPDYFHRYKLQSLVRFIDEAALPKKTILDFGSGVGNSIPHFRALLPQASLLCADVSARSLDIARQRFPGSERHILIESSLAPIENDSLDIAFSSCVFHHIDHTQHAFWLTQLRDRLRPGGLVCIFEHNPLNVLTRHAVNTCPFDVDAHLIGGGAFASRLRDAGFVDVKIAYTTFFPHCMAPLRRFEHHLAWLPIGAQYRLTAFRPR
jgi:SAM-dependent methyltransferase